MRRARVRNKTVLLAAVLSVTLLTACSDKRPTGVLSPKKLEAVLYDYHLVQSMISELPSSERYQKDLYFDYIYAKHGITAATLDSSLVYYARYPKELSLLYVRLSDRVERDIQRIKDQEVPLVTYAPVAVEGDSADLWFDAPLVQLTPSPLHRRFSTTVPHDTNFKAHDSFVWSGKALFTELQPDSLHRYLRLALTAEYANDSLLVVDTLLYTTGDYHLSITDTLGYQLRSLTGDAYYKATHHSGEVLMHGFHLMRYHQPLPADTLQTDSVHHSID